MSSRQLRVAAVQAHTRVGDVRANLEHLAPLVEEAALGGAQLIVLPELAAAGYSMSSRIWDSAEAYDGPTVRWLAATSARLSAYVGIGFVEARGEDFYNTYALGAPDGQILGCIRKTMAETACFKGVRGRHVIDAPFGRIGIGICADNQFVPMVRFMQQASVDLMLMPHAWPGPFRTGGLVSQADVDGTYARARDIAPLYARLLGVPSVFVNHVGPRGAERWAGLIGSMMNPDQFQFLGQSTIADSDARVVAQLDDRIEGVSVADVRLDPARKVRGVPRAYGRYGGGWLHAGTSGDLARDAICYVDAFVGRLSYTLSRQRRRQARQCARTTARRTDGGVVCAG
jgi:N-carbamoylputrescine amidase